MSLQATEPEAGVDLTAEDIAEIRRLADDDAFYFGRVICGHRDLVFEDHAPLMYAAEGRADKLLAVLRNPAYDSDVIRDIKAECIRQDIDISAENAESLLFDRLRVVDLRVFRGSGKSSAITHAVRLKRMTNDPNLTSCIITNTEPKALDFCRQIRATILSDIYGAVYPERVPADQKACLKENAITLAGRTVPDKEPCLMAFGHKSSPVGYHFDEIHCDDLVARENKSIPELAMVAEFLANLTALYNPGIRYRVRRIHVGTRWDDADDCAIVRKYNLTFCITIPIWRRSADTEDLRSPGVPTMRWFPLERILEKLEEILSNEDEGPISWRCNFELDPSIAGGKIFPDALVDAAKWVPFKPERAPERDSYRPKSLFTPLSERARALTWMMRPKYDRQGQPIPAMENGEQKKTKDGKPIFVFEAIDPLSLYIVAAVDQSFAEDGDEWAVAVEGMDPDGHRYLLEPIRAGRGVEAMLDAMLAVYTEWRPQRFGQEKIQCERLMELLLKLAEKYRPLYGIIEGVSHKNESKEIRARNFVAAVMKMHRLWIDPHDSDTVKELKRYKPSPVAKDNRIDVLGMCEVLAQRAVSKKGDGRKRDENDYRTGFERANKMANQRRDPQTGMAV